MVDCVAIQMRGVVKGSPCAFTNDRPLSSRQVYVPASTCGFGTDNIQNESFLDVRARTYRAVHTMYTWSNTKTASK